jgi:hypothetical protein
MAKTIIKWAITEFPAEYCNQQDINSVALVHERIILTERTASGEISANFCG